MALHPFSIIYRIRDIVVDYGYESEENYCYFETLSGTNLYVKQSDHEQKKTRKHRTDISRRENMAYDPKTDSYAILPVIHTSL